jgi:hypothetical protein
LGAHVTSPKKQKSNRESRRSIEVGQAIL